MKKLLILSTICTLNSIFSPIWGQGGGDSLRYTQETGTLEKQAFVNEYDYIFMMQEPAKYLLKFGILTSSNQINLQYGIEKKLNNSWSINTNAYLGRMSSYSSHAGFWIDIEPRYYLNMSNRIKKGISANNLNGTYVGIAYQMPIYQEKLLIGKTNYNHLNTVGLSLGWQRRIGSSFFADLSLLAGVRRGQPVGCEGTDCETVVYSSAGLIPFLMTNARVGISSTFLQTKYAKPELCPLIKCYENITQLWKIDLLQLFQLDRYYQASTLGIEYERAIGKGFTINTGVRFQIEHFQGIIQTPSDTGQPSKSQYVSDFFVTNIAGIDIRYYPKVSKEVASQQAANQLSGFYYCIGFQRNTNLVGASTIRHPNVPQIGIGIQQKISAHGFLNIQVMFGFPIQSNRLTSISNPSMRLGFAF
jgi:hypothetical protein